jgi:hypothetical protein
LSPPESVRAPKGPTCSRVFNQQFRAGFVSGHGLQARLSRQRHWLALRLLSDDE